MEFSFEAQQQTIMCELWKMLKVIYSRERNTGVYTYILNLQTFLLLGKIALYSRTIPDNTIPYKMNSA